MDYTYNFFDVLCSPQWSPINDSDGGDYGGGIWFEAIWFENYDHKEYDDKG